MKALSQKGMLAFLTPIFWVFLVITDLVIFAEGRAKSLIGRLFEDVVFVTSFFFYNASWGMNPAEQTYSKLIFPFFLQFFFWWIITFLILLFLNRPKKTKG